MAKEKNPPIGEKVKKAQAKVKGEEKTEKEKEVQEEINVKEAKKDNEAVKKVKKTEKNEKEPEKNFTHLIKFDKVSKIFKDDYQALRNIDLRIAPGEFISLVGPSGAGKSTLLKLIYAEENPSEGQVFFEDKPVDSISRRKIPKYRRNIGTVFQDFRLLPKKTAFENVAYALEVSGVPSDEILEDVPQILDIVGLLSKMDKFPLELSGGEQQKIAMARALIHKPKVIIADEPTGNLDPISSDEVIKLLLSINKLGTTVILATHNKSIVDKAAKRVVVIEEGKIISDVNRGKYKIC